MQRLQIDLKKNPADAELVSDKEVGTSIFSKLSIVSKDEQTLAVDLETTAASASDLEGPEDEDEEKEEVAEDDSGYDTPAMAVARGTKNASKGKDESE